MMTRNIKDKEGKSNISEEQKRMKKEQNKQNTNN